MPTETSAPDVLIDQAENQEIEITAESLCESLRDVVSLQRHAVGTVLHINPAIFTAGNISTYPFPWPPEEILKKVDVLVNSQQMTSHVETCIANGNYPELLKDEQLRSYVIGLARAGFLGGLIKGFMDVARINPSHKRIYRDRLIDVNHVFKEFADGDFGREHGIKRSHLIRIINDAYGVTANGLSGQLAERLEIGITAEIATKRYIEDVGPQLGVHVRYANAAEDAKKMDLVCTHGHKTLGIDVKSGDKNSGRDGEARASRSPIEEHGLNDYRVRELYPSKASCIGDDFEIKAKSYRDTIDNLLSEFVSL